MTHAHTVRLSLQLWDRERQVRMSVHRDVATTELATAAGEILGDMLPAFSKPPKPHKGRTAAAGAQSGQMFFRRRGSVRR